MTKLTPSKEFKMLKKALGKENTPRIIAGEKFTLTFENEKVSKNKEGTKLTKTQKFWVVLYKKYFGMDIDPSIIKKAEGKWEIFIPKGLTAQRVFDALPFPKWQYFKDLDKGISINDRLADKDYIVYVNQNIEADEQFKNKSANDLEKMNHVGITLLERLVLELKYFEETGQHLDVNNVTLCSGSRDSDGDVPHVRWYGDELKISWEGTSYSYDDLRSREVILP